MLRYCLLLILTEFLLILPGYAIASPQEDRDITAVPVDKPETGVFLVASRQMPDPRFQHSVILLLNHGKDGTLGLIINRPTGISLSEAVPELKHFDRKRHFLFFGGPVAINTLLFLIRSEKPPAHAISVLDNIYASGDSKTLEQVLRKAKSTNQLRLYFGHAGWAPGQLNAELARGSWHLFQAKPATIFHDQPDILWEKFIEKSKAQQIIVKTETPSSGNRQN